MAPGFQSWQAGFDSPRLLFYGLCFSVGEKEMLCARSLLLFLLFVSLSQAQSVVILDNGRAWYVPTSSSVAIPVDRIIRLGGPTEPPIDPPTDPTDPTDSELKTLSATWPSKVDDYPQKQNHRRSLHTIYSLLGEQSSVAGRFDSLDHLQRVTETMRDVALGQSGIAAWREWGGDVGDWLRANVSSLDAAGPAYLDVADGLGSNEAIGAALPVIIKLLLKFVLANTDLDPAIIELIQTLLGGFFGQ